MPQIIHETMMLSSIDQMLWDPEFGNTTKRVILDILPTIIISIGSLIIMAQGLNLSVKFLHTKKKSQ